MLQFIKASFILLFIPVLAFAGAGKSLVYTGRIIKPDGNPLESSNVQFTIGVYSPGAEDCLLYEETQNLNMTSSLGAFALAVGEGTRTGGYLATQLETVFQNDTQYTGLTCAVGTTFDPTASPNNTDRVLKVSFTDGSPSVTLSPQPIKSVPYALQARNASKAVDVTGTANISSMILRNASNNQINITAPSAAFTNFSLVLPNTDGGVGDLLQTDGSGNLSWIAPGAFGGGTVSSVDVSVPAYMTSSGGPITTAGSITLGFGSQSAATVFAGPGAAPGAPSFRALLATDIPSLDAAAIGSGVLPIARGGTNSSTALNNDRMIFSAAGAIKEMAAMTNGQIIVGVTGAAPSIVSVSGDATLSSAGALTLNTVTVAKGGTNAISFSANKIVGTNGTGSALVDFTCPTGNAITFDASGNAGCTDVAGVANAFVKNGNSFGGTATLGTNDANSLAFETNGTTKMTLLSTGELGIGTPTPATKLEVSGVTRSVGLDVSNATNYVQLRAPASFSNYTLTFPADDGTPNQVLTTDGAGILSWTTPAASVGGTGTTGKVPKFSAASTVADSQITDNGAAGVDIGNSLLQFGGTLWAHKTGTANTFVGASSGNTALTVGNAINNTAVGYQALSSVTDGYGNVAMGKGALVVDTTGYRNVAIGENALPVNTTGASNYALGFGVMNSNISGSSNVAMGRNALYLATSGNNNVAIGHQAGWNANAGSSSNVFIGDSAGPTAAAAISNQLYIDNSINDTPLIGGDFSANTVAINGSLNVTGNAGVGAPTPRAAFDVSLGSIIGKASTLNATSTVDFAAGNIQHTTSDCGAFQLNNLKDGGAYMFVVKGTNSNTCSFTAFSDAGSTPLTVHLPPDHGPTVTGKHTMYNLAVSGGDVYFAWTPGY